jgi:hypothetical protein
VTASKASPGSKGAEAPEPAAPGSHQEAPAAKAGRRVYLGWAIGLGLLVSVGVFCVLVLRPWIQVRSVVTGFKPGTGQQEATKAVAQLGGPGAAGYKLRLYLRMPGRLAPNRHVALVVLGHCGADAAPTLNEFLAESEDPGFILGSLADSSDPRAFEVLAELAARYGSTGAVDWLTDSQDPRVPGFLASLIGDARVGKAAADALERIRSKEPRTEDAATR